MLTGETYPKTDKNLPSAPAQQGVYVLLLNNEIIYIGRAAGPTVTIRSRLNDHASGRSGGTKGFTHYMREVVADPVQREAFLLAQYKKQYGKLPSFNERIG